MEDSSILLKDGYMFMEYLEDDGKWYLTQVPYEIALAAVVQWPDKYHMLDSSMVLLDYEE